MQFGVKVGSWLSENYVREISKYADFFEIYSTLGSEFDYLYKIDKPYIIHIPHFGSKINFANPLREKENTEVLEHSIKIANKFGCEKIIFHPELRENKLCSIDVVVNFLLKHYDHRLLVENMPTSSEGFRHFCNDIDELTKVMSELEIGFCFDSSHAVQYAVEENEDIFDYLKRMISLKPQHHHLTDMDVNLEKIRKGEGDHLSLYKGNLDIDFILDITPSDAMVTVETPMVLETQIEEINSLRKKFNVDVRS